MSSTSDRRDPKPDVVTGYPAAASTSAAPTPGTAYPYPALPPQAASFYPNPNPNGYYPNPNPNPNGYYPNPNPNYNAYYSNPNPSYNRNLFFRRLLAIAVAVLLIVGAITFILWLIIRPKLPDFSVSSFSVSNFNISSPDSLSSDFSLNLTVRNPNKKMSIAYDRIAAAVLYDDSLIAETGLSPFFQRTGDVTNINAKLVAVGAHVGSGIVSGIRYEKGKGVVNFNIRFGSVVKFKAGVWRARNRFLRVYCDDIGVGFKNTTAGPWSGSMLGAARSCQAWL